MTNRLKRMTAVAQVTVIAFAALVVWAPTRSGDASADPAGTAIPVSQAAEGMQLQMVKVVKAVSPAVVQIQTSTGLGSGVVFDDNGNVVTNAHVVEGSKSFVVTLSDGARHPARLAGVDARHDLAVVRIDGARPAKASFADSSKLEVGDVAIAIGNPLGLQSSVTQGIVSSVDRKVSEQAGVTLSSVIQTSADMNPGNSGGALVDVAGQVIGIPTMTATDPEMGCSAAGIGFAIPSNTATRIARRLIAPKS